MDPRHRQKIVWAALGALLVGTWFAVTCQSPPRQPEGSALESAGPDADGLFPLTIGQARVRVEVAASSAERELGLMHRDSLPWERGMLFVFPDKRRMSFWMKNTRIPLSIAFMRSDGEVAEILDMQPMTERTHLSKSPGRFALEVNQGWFDKEGVGVGDRLVGLPRILAHLEARD